MPRIERAPQRSTFALLDQIVTVLGGTKLSFWPFLSGIGTTTFPYGSGNDGILLTASSAIESILDPSQHVGGVHSLANDGTTSYLSAADNANFSFGNGTVDAPFSVGAWIMMHEAVGTQRAIMAKYRTDAVAALEWRFIFNTSGKLILGIYDDDAAANELATSAGTALTPFVWQFAVATYDGGETAPVINIYLNGASVHDGTSVETGAYVAMEDLTGLLTIGHQNSPTPATVFQGRIALPFLCGKELTAAEVATLYGLGRALLGIG